MQRAPNPVQALVVSFALVIAFGTWCLRQPWAAVPGKQLGWIEALFTATSATCVTGLVVRPPEDHTLAGQLVILALIQIGGLGILTFGLFVLLLAGQRLSLFGRQLLVSSLSGRPWEDFWPLLRTVFGATAVVEALGTLFLVAGWWDEKGWHALGWGTFYAVSAFCNAGFGLHAQSLAPWRSNPLIVVPIGLLIISGGVGFFPLAELWRRCRSGGRAPLSLHTKAVLIVTAWLLVIGWAGFALLEWGTTLRGLAGHEKALAIWFAGITPRTAGFSTLEYGAMNPATLVFTMGLMFIGASPGSTGGGVKTTTIAVLFAVIVTRIRSRRQVQSFKRGISAASVGDALVVMLLASAVVLAGVLLVLLAEHGFAGGVSARCAFLAEAFEVVSAFGTVGLSTGLTPSLSPLSWVVLSAIMFIGRVGPLTVGLALAGRRPRPEPAWAEESIMVG